MSAFTTALSSATTNVVAPSTQLISDSTATSAILKRGIESYQIDVCEIQEQIDSLRRSVEMHSVKEDLFSSQLSIQTGLFSLIVFGLLTLAGMVNWRSLLRSEKQLEKVIASELDKTQAVKSELLSKMQSVQDEVKISQRNIMALSGNFSTMVGEEWKKLGKLDMAFYHFVHAAKYGHSAAAITPDDIGKQRQFEVADRALLKCMKLADERQSTHALQQLDGRNDELMGELLSALGDLMKSEHELIKEKSSYLFVIITQVKNAANQSPVPPTS